jgi:hypothetical protein
MSSVVYHASWLLIASLVMSIPDLAHADASRLIMSLDVPIEQTPEYLCIVSTSRSCPAGQPEGSGGELLVEKGCQTRELSDLQDIGSLPANLGGGDIAFAPPVRETARRYNSRRENEVAFDQPLWEALKSLSHRRRTPACDDAHDGCTPKVRLSGFDHPDNGDRTKKTVAVATRRAEPTILCGRDELVRSGRVAILSLAYHGGESGSAVQRIELRGTSATLLLRHDLPASSYAFAQVLGGDYVFSHTEAIGTNERITVTLRPRCTLFSAQLPIHALDAPLAGADLQVDIWGEPGAREPIASCKPRVQPSTLPINIPYLDDAETKRLVVREAAPESEASPALEATWNGPLPEHPLRLAYRRFELVWRRHCLAGEWPASEPVVRDHSWDRRCPRATVDDVLRCTVVDQPDTEVCRYRCTIDASSPPMPLPSSVRFERFRRLGDEDRLLYAWNDRVSYSRQELSSFVADAELKVVVDIPDPAAWRSRVGNEIDRIDVSIDSADQPQRIPIGEALPTAWTVIAAPSATCSSQFRIDIVGARAFARRRIFLDRRRSLVLTSPTEYPDRLHATFTIGVGMLLPNDPGSGFRGEPYAVAGIGGERYFDRPWSWALEASLLYEPTYTAYGAVPRPYATRTDPINVAYHRGMIEIAGVTWGHNRYWEAGPLVGGGIGGPMFRGADQVGPLHWFVLGGLLVRFNPFPLTAHAAFEIDGGLRWGERHEYFGVDAQGHARPDRFHGDVSVSEPRIWQAYASLRWRLAFR